MKDLKITYFGVMRSPTSWAKVGREMVAALKMLGTDVDIYERKGFLYNKDFVIPSGLDSLITARFSPERTVFTFEHPHNYRYISGRRKIGLLTWETTLVPEDWIESINRHLDLLLVPSRFCYEAFLKSGLRVPALILPYGFNPQVYSRNAEPYGIPTKKRFIFLTSALPHHREGIDLLLDAYGSAFRRSDDVALVVKTSYVPSGKKKGFEYADLTGVVEKFASVPDHPEIVCIFRELSEQEMAGLYCASSAYVSATRGEGFGICFLEALACGKPVIATGWGGHRDFLDTGNACMVRFSLSEEPDMQYGRTGKGSFMARPDINDLAAKMRCLYANYSGCLEKVRDFGAHMNIYTWEEIALRFTSILKRIGG